MRYLAIMLLFILFSACSTQDNEINTQNKTQNTLSEIESSPNGGWNTSEKLGNSTFRN